MGNIIYVDILFITNALIGYFTLRASCKLGGDKCTTLRIILASIVAGFSAMIIFIELNNWLLWLYKITSAILVCYIAFTAKNIRMFLKLVVWYLMLNFALAGTVFAIQYYFSVQGMQVNNLTLYINVSPLVLLFSVLSVYLSVNIICLIFAKPQENVLANIEFNCKGNVIACKALVDSGFRVKDAISGKDAFLVSYSDVKHLLPLAVSQILLLYLSSGNASDNTDLHLVCIHTAAGTQALPAVKVNSLTVKIGSKCDTFKDVMAVFTSEMLGGGSFSAIIGMSFAKNCL
ncbi:MAG: sigma-E processing peptidase SpoIIGA [Oscillospiraceae bacterium]